MNRKTVLVGDPLNTGGTVLGNDCRSSINGIPKAWIGGKAWCEVCQSEGTLAKAGGPYRPINYGGEEVLEGDLVLCHCPVAPKVVARAVSMRPPLVMVDDRVEKLGALPPPFRQFCNFSGLHRGSGNLAHTIQFVIEDEGTGRPLSLTRYRILLSNNTEYLGVTNADGLTETVGSDSPFTATIEIPYYGGRKEESSPIHPENSDHGGAADMCSC